MKKLLLWIVLVMVVLGGGGAWRYGQSDQVQPQASPYSSVDTPPARVQVTSGVPQTISIPKIGVEAKVEKVGLDSQKRMDVPKNVNNVGWYELGFRPGERGSAVLDGHLDTVTGAPAVFYYLTSLAPGDQIIVTDDQGKTYTYQVEKQVAYPYNQVPLEEVFASSDKPRLNLITCNGIWDVGNSNYSQRVVVYSVLI